MNRNGHTVVGQVYNYSLDNLGTYAYCILKRSKDSHSPVIIGQFVTILTEGDDDSVMLGKVEKFQPDGDPQMKESLRQATDANRRADAHYRKQGMYISCSVKIIGSVTIKGENLKFYSNVRELKTVMSLQLAIPDANFLASMARAAVLDSDSGMFSSFEIGSLKYGTNPKYTEEFYGGANRVPIMFNAANLLRKRTAIYGKSGYGKSNAVKTVIGMMASKFPNCGQIIFDTNGEYALENDQNDGFMDIFHEAGIKGRTVLYTSRKVHEEKKAKFGEDSFKPMRFDIFENISASMEIVMANFTGDTVPMYLHAWIQEAAGVEDQKELFSNVRGNKGIVWGIWYYCCLQAGLSPISEVSQYSQLRVSEEFLDYIVEQAGKEGEPAIEPEKEDDKDVTLPAKVEEKKPDKDTEVSEPLSIEVEMEQNDAAHGRMKDNFSFSGMSFSRQEALLKELKIVKLPGARTSYVTKNIYTMAQYADWKIQILKAKEKRKKKDGAIELDSNEESSIKPYAELVNYYRRLFQLKNYNIGNIDDAREKQRASSMSLGDSVWKDLLDKKIIMIDLASVSSREAKVLSEQIAAIVLSRSSKLFGDSTQSKMFKDFDALVFIEESQNYLSKEQVNSGTGIWERIAKEGRKFHLGLVYITQQPTAIDERISSQTENIIALHMSSLSDTMFLNKIKDKFDELTCKFLKDEAEKGLAFIYSEPHQPFVLPVQIHLFNKELILSGLRDSKKDSKKGK